MRSYSPMGKRILLVAISFLLSCGGSSSGGRDFFGTIVDQTGRPIPTVLVTVLGDGTGGETNAEGEYRFGYSSEIDSLTLFFKQEDLGIQLSYALPNIPEETGSVLQDFTINTENNTISRTRLRFEND